MYYLLSNYNIVYSNLQDKNYSLLYYIEEHVQNSQLFAHNQMNNILELCSGHCVVRCTHSWYI
jgi:hypothetical protein